mgnify:CR=1 FL=1
MRFPWSLVKTMSIHLFRSRMRGRRRPPLVLMLEPLFACNLACEGCGRIREYAAMAHQQMSLEECLHAARECDAPVVSVCGGEPLLYRDLDRLVSGLLSQKRFIYLCTNGLLIPRWLDRLPRTERLTWNIHLDGMEATHDAITGRPGTFREVTRAIRLAKEAGMRVTTNTTIYACTDMHEVIVLLEYLTELGVDGMLLSPAYPYECLQSAPAPHASVAERPRLAPGGCATAPSEFAKAPAPTQRKNAETTISQERPLFLTRAEVARKFLSVKTELRRFRLINSPLYLDFLMGLRDLPCAAWASPTRNVCGWKSPCYLVTNDHFCTFREWQEKTPWQSLGPGRDPRCENCLVHYGFETGAVFAAQKSLRDSLSLALWQLGR